MSSHLNVSAHLPARRVFDTTELLKVICGSMENRSLASLLTISRNFFHCAAPLVWKDITGLSKLMGLLPRMEPDEPGLDQLSVSALHLTVTAACSHVKHTGYPTP